MNKRIYITGWPGTGKSSLVAEFNRRGIFAFGIDEIDGLCTWTDIKTGEPTDDYFPVKEWLISHEWICDIEKLKSLMNKSNELVIVTGVASNQNGFLNLFDKVFLLRCPQETLIQRLMQRRHEDGNHFGEHKEEREYITDIFQGFEEKLLAQGAIAIDCSKPLSKVADIILNKI